MMLSAALLLSGCGGGGGGEGPGSPIAGDAAPSSGTYAWLLRSQGSTADLRYGISLVHADSTAIEHVIEPTSANVADVKLLPAGSVDAAGLRATGVKPQTLLYIVGGDVRSLPMDANGAAPKGRVQRAQSSNACRFLIDAVDYAVPANSRSIVATAGADGRCENAAGRAELKFSATGTPSLMALTDGAPLGSARHPATLAPYAWIYPKKVVFWTTSSGSSVATRNDLQAGFTAVVLSTHRSTLVDDGGRLSLLEFGSDSTVSVRPLDAGLTAGGNWQPIGFDADNFYVFRNSSGAASGTWQIVKIGRSAGAASAMASGSGLLSNASMGNGRLYASVVGVADNRLITISKATGAVVQTLENTPSSVFTSVLTSANNVHQLFRVSNIGTSIVSYTIEMIDESGARLYSTAVGGFTLALADPASINFNASESRTRFVFVSGFGSRGFADTALTAYDTASRATTVMGTLPGVPDFGQDVVFANVVGGPGNLMGGFAARSNGGVIEASGAKVYSFDVAVANSLRITTTQR